MSMRRATSIVLTALLAGSLGYWAGRFNTPDLSASSGAAVHSRRIGIAAPASKALELEPPRESSLMQPELRMLLGNDPVPDASMQAKVMQVLEEPDAVRRTAAVTLLLENMNPANADTFREAFLGSTAKSGRRHDNEWGLMLRQYGKVLGAEAMKRLKEVPQDAQKAFEGWAIADQTGVQEWLAPNHPDYLSLRKTMLSGIALTDPEMAFRLVLSDPGGPMDPGWIIQAGILGTGTDGVTAALQRALDSSAPEAVDHPAFASLFGNLTGAVFRQKWEARESLKMLPWLESLRDQPFVTGDMIGHGAMDAVLQGNLKETLDWLDRMEGPAARPVVREGLLRGVLGNSDLLARADEASLDRIIARFPGDARSLGKMGQAVAEKNPAHGARLRMAAGSGP